MPGRKYSQANTTYRYGFNGKENDNDVKGEGNQQDYGMRIYDPRVGKFLSVDPLTKSYPWYTPYQFAGNMPIANIDLDGLEPLPATTGKEKMGDEATTSTSSEINTPGGQAGCSDCLTKTVNTVYFWKWYDGSLNREQKAGWYSKGEYDKITQDWEHGQVMQPLTFLEKKSFIH